MKITADDIKEIVNSEHINHERLKVIGLGKYYNSEMEIKFVTKDANI